MSDSTAEPASPLDREAAPAPPAGTLRELLKQRAYVTFWSGRTLASLAGQAEGIALAWHVYNVARLHGMPAQGAFALGMLGLAQFLPMFACALPAGDAADRYDRRMIMAVTAGVEFLTAAAFTAIAFWKVESLWPIYGLAVVFGVARSFQSPAGTALAPTLVPRSLLPRAVAMSSISWQTAAVVGPAIGGLLIAVSPVLAFAACGVAYLVSLVALFAFTPPRQVSVGDASRVAQIREGLDFLWSNKIVLGAISLDLFAVLLGGATALLPVFARDVLQVGPEGFGVLRAAPAVGGLAIAGWLAIRPTRSRAGLKLFLGVGAFGLATVVFALSRSMWLSTAALVALGAADMVSVFVRQSLVQIATPDAMRGRVSAVSYLFIGASNELGEFETGLVARVLGPIGAAVFGGVGSLVVTGLWAAIFPDLRKYDRLE